MTTGNKHWIINSTRLAASSDLKDRFQTSLRADIEAGLEKVYPDDGAFGALFTLGLAIIDNIQVGGGPTGTDGKGHILDTSLATEDGASIPFENELGVDYHVALKSEERPFGIQINPRTGDPEYTETREDIGDKADPDLVVDNGSNITFRVNSVLEPGVDHSGREVAVYRKIPADGATTEAIAIEVATVAYAAPNNSITTTDLLGQSTVSTSPADYEVYLLGPTVRRNTDLSTVDGILYIGTVTGGGAGSVPSGSDTSGQTNISVNLSNFNNALDAFAVDNNLASSRAGHKDDMLTPVVGAHGVLYSDGLIYIMGGGTDPAVPATVTDANQAYDPSVDAWTAKTVIPVQSNGGAPIGARSRARCAVVGTSIYLMGGYDGAVVYELTQKYDPLTNTWDTVRADMPAARAGGAVGVIDGKIYYAGGFSGAIAAGHDDTYEYDPVLDSWSTVASISTVISTEACFQYFGVIDDKLYVFGGFRPGTGLDTERSFFYDPAADVWAALPDLPLSPFTSMPERALGSAVAARGLIWLLGGRSFTEARTDDVILYNPINNDYRLIERMRFHRIQDHVAIAGDNDSIYIMGGNSLDPGTPSAVNIGAVAGFDVSEVVRAPSPGIACSVGNFQVKQNDVGWVTTEPNGHTMRVMMQPHAEHRAAVYRGAVYIHGGVNSLSAALDNLQRYDPYTNSWTELATSANNRRLHGFVADDSRSALYAIGGVDEAAAFVTAIEMYDIFTNSWSSIGTYPNTKAAFGYAYVDNKIYMFGGERPLGTEVNTIVEWDVVTDTETPLTAVMPTTLAHFGAVAMLSRHKDGGPIGDANESNGKMKIWMGGGYDGAVAVNNIYVYDIEQDTLLNTGLTLASGIRSGHSVVGVEAVGEDQTERRVVFVGGTDAAGTARNTHDEFDPDTGVSAAGDAFIAGPTAFDDTAAAVVDGELFVFGGRNLAAAFLDDVQRNDKFTHPTRAIPENYSSSDNPLDTPNLLAYRWKRDAIGFKQNDAYGMATWDPRVDANFVRIGES